MNQSLKEDKLTANASERKARELQSKIDMLNQVEQVLIFNERIHVHALHFSTKHIQ